MRGLTLTFAIFAVTMPGYAWADGDCPEHASTDVLTAMGQPAADLGHGTSVYVPAGATAMGLPVSYVVVMKGSGGAVEEIDYRLQGVMRKFSDHYPKPVLEAFDKAYPGVGCAGGRVTSCGATFDLKAGATDALGSARIGDPGLDVPAKTDADVLKSIKTDYAQSDSGPVFLVCSYGS